MPCLLRCGGFLPADCSPIFTGSKDRHETIGSAGKKIGRLSAKRRSASTRPIPASLARSPVARMVRTAIWIFWWMPCRKPRYSISVVCWKLKLLLGVRVDLVTSDGLSARMRTRVLGRPVLYEQDQPARICRAMIALLKRHLPFTDEQFQFLLDLRTQMATTMALMLLGEAVSRISRSTLISLPPIRKFLGSRSGMRNMMAHDYNELEMQVVGAAKIELVLDFTSQSSPHPHAQGE